MAAQLIPQRLCPSGVVEQPDLVVTEVTRHGAWKTDVGESSGNDDAIKVGKYASSLTPGGV